MISPAGLASPLLLLVGYVGTAVGHRESYSLFLHNNVDLNVLGHKTLKLRQFYSVCLSLRLTVTVGEVDEAAGAGVAVLSAVVRFAEAATGPILTGTICELGLTVAACREAKREKQHKTWYDMKESVLMSPFVIWRTAETHVSRPAGTRWGDQVTCSRSGCSARSWLQWCDAERVSIRDTSLWLSS